MSRPASAPAFRLGCAFLAFLLCLANVEAADDDTVIVTATRTPEALEDTLAAVTVITREDIERQQAQSVEELLRGIPGVAYDNVGGIGKAASFFIRGTESDHTVVLVDGIPFGSPTLGIAAYEHLPLDRIERIEIVRGPRSAVYGPNAIGGVINFITRGSRDEEARAVFQAGYGSHATRRVSASVDAAGARGWFSAGVAEHTTNGFNACVGHPFPPGGGCFTSEPDRDGYDSTSGSLHAGFRIANGTDLEARLLTAKGATEFDGTFTNRTRFVEQAASLRLAHQVSDHLGLSAVAGRAVDDTRNFVNETFSSRFETWRDSLSIQGDWSIGTHSTMTAGFDYLQDHVDSTVEYSTRSRTNRGAFLLFNGNAGRHQWTGGARHDRDEQFGDRDTASLTYGLELTPRIRLISGGGTAFKAPTFNELYFPNFGNPDLGVERARSFEAGVSGSSTRSSWSARAFGTTIDDLISFDAATFRAENIDKARVLGLEIEGSWRLGAWLARAALTAMKAENRSDSDQRGNDLPRRARESARLELWRQLDRVEVGTVVIATGRRYDDLDNTTPLAGYATVDLNVAFRMSPVLVLRARVGNLFNTGYETASLFNQDGRNGWLNIEYAAF